MENRKIETNITAARLELIGLTLIDNSPEIYPKD